MGSKTVKLSKETHDMIDMARKEFLRYHPEMAEIQLSNNKILSETLKYYIRN